MPVQKQVQLCHPYVQYFMGLLERYDKNEPSSSGKDIHKMSTQDNYEPGEKYSLADNNINYGHASVMGHSFINSGMPSSVKFIDTG